MPPRSLRKRPVTLDEAHESGEEDAAPKLSVEDTRLLQRQRQRQTGVDAAALLQGRRDDEDRELALASAAASAAPEEGGLHAAFKRERQQDEGADNPHMPCTPNHHPPVRPGSNMWRPSWPLGWAGRRRGRSSRRHRAASTTSCLRPASISERTTWSWGPPGSRASRRSRCPWIRG
ncbi:hypothetical protein ACKKBG_A29325 [Auxenochlorella protothecoides x Auxenochlorella symbiontica]